jgi:hypothetical protein
VLLVQYSVAADAVLPKPLLQLVLQPASVLLAAAAPAELCKGRLAGLLV